MFPRNKFLILFFVLFHQLLFSQSAAENFKSNILNSGNVDKKRDLKSEISKYDFSKVLLHTPSHSVYGFIGKDYQRMQVKIISVAKDSRNPLRYLVKGKTKVKENICDFKGTMVINSIFENSKIDGSVAQQGIALGDYMFYEDSTQQHTGVFKGIFCLRWCLDANMKFKYDDVALVTQGFTNNSFVGTWTSYKTKVIKPCHWGDFRVPESGNLDMGGQEFSPNFQYVENGWQNYVNAYLEKNEGTEAAIAEEKREWWK